MRVEVEAGDGDGQRDGPSELLSPEARTLLATWAGPHGGLPPLAPCNPAAIEEALLAALAMKRAEVEAISANTAPPSFENTAEALEDCGRPLARVLCVYRVHAGSLSLGDMPAVAQRMAPLLAALEDEMAHDERLYARLDSVWRDREQAGLHPEQQRLLQVLIARMQRRGAALAPAAKARLAQIQARLAQLSTRYSQNLIYESDTQAVFITSAAGLHGLPEAARHAASAAAADAAAAARSSANERSTKFDTMRRRSLAPAFQ